MSFYTQQKRFTKELSEAMGEAEEKILRITIEIHEIIDKATEPDPAGWNAESVNQQAILLLNGLRRLYGLPAR